MRERFLQTAVEQGADYVQFPETVDYIGTEFGRFAREHRGKQNSFFLIWRENMRYIFIAEALQNIRKEENQKHHVVFRTGWNSIGKVQ